MSYICVECQCTKHNDPILMPKGKTCDTCAPRVSSPQVKITSIPPLPPVAHTHPLIPGACHIFMPHSLYISNMGMAHWEIEECFNGNFIVRRKKP